MIKLESIENIKKPSYNYKKYIIRMTYLKKIDLYTTWVYKNLSTPAGIRTRVRALATPGDNRYTTGVICTFLVPRPGFEPGTTASSGQRSPTELPGL